MDNFDDTTFTTALPNNNTSFSMENMLEAMRLLKELDEKYPQKDKIDILLVTYNSNLIAPETILKSEYEGKVYIMMNFIDFNKLVEQSKITRTFQEEYHGLFSFSRIPVWYDDELIKKIFDYHAEKIMEKYRKELWKNFYPFSNSFFLEISKWN